MDANLLYFLLGIIAIIPIDLFILPRLRKWQSDLPQLNRQKKQKELASDLAYIEELYNDKSKLIAYAISTLTTILTVFTLALAMLIMSVLLLIVEARNSVLHNLEERFIYTQIHLNVGNALAIVGVVLLVIGINLFSRYFGTLSKIKQYDTFKNQTETRIQQLS